MVKALFTKNLTSEPTAYARAYGRANLIGDHTDYNDGFVLPCLLRCHTDIALRHTDTGQIAAVSEGFGTISAALDSPPDGSWLDFVRGATALLASRGITTNGLEIAVRSSIPAGAGVSSSAALEIGLLRGLLALHDSPPLPAADMARIAQKIEHDFVGTDCGIMDQMVCAAANQGEAMLLDCRSLDKIMLPLFRAADFLVIHSGSSRKLSDGAYNARLSECKAAALALSVSSLRDARAEDVVGLSDPILAARARHVISENLRVLAAAEALKSQDAKGFGQLMTQSHRSLAADYDVSSLQLDRLVQASAAAGAYGARLTGAGFGGCIIALVAAGDAERISDQIIEACPDSWLVDRITV